MSKGKEHRKKRSLESRLRLPYRSRLLGDSVETLEKATSAAILVSEKAMGIEHTGRQIRALTVFAKTIAHVMTIARVVDVVRTSPPGATVLDHFSVATLARSAIDAALMTLYLSDLQITLEQWQLRRHVLFLHDATTRKRFLESSAKIGGERDEEFFSSYEVIRDDLRAKIHGFCLALQKSPVEIERLMTGQFVFVDGARGAAREAGWDVNEFGFAQEYLSSHVHSHPVSFMRAKDHNISFQEPSEFQYAVSSVAIEMAASALASATERMTKFAGDFARDHLGQVD